MHSSSDTLQLGRAPLADNSRFLADNSRFLYADETSSISDGHIVNIYGYNENAAPRIMHEDMDDFDEYGDGVSWNCHRDHH